MFPMFTESIYLYFIISDCRLIMAAAGVAMGAGKKAALAALGRRPGPPWPPWAGVLGRPGRPGRPAYGSVLELLGPGDSWSELKRGTVVKNQTLTSLAAWKLI